MSDKENNEKQRYIIFDLSGQHYAFSLLTIQEVIGSMSVTPVPNVPKYFRGLINLRGKIISVIDLRVKFGMPLPKEISKTSSIIICILNNSVIGCVVDEVVKVESYLDSEIDFSSSQTERHAGEGVIGVVKGHSEMDKDAKVTEEETNSSGMTLLLSIDKMLSSNDLKLMAKTESSNQKG